MIIRYLRNDNGTPWATLVSFGPQHVAASVCSPKDQFSKRMGRWLAIRRALAGSTRPKLFDAHRDAALGEAIARLAQRSEELAASRPYFFQYDESVIDGVNTLAHTMGRRETNQVLNELASALVDNETLEFEYVNA